MDWAAKQAFLQALEQDTGFRDEVRRRLLMADLIELPERLAAFIAAAEQRFTRLETALATLIEFAEQTNRRLQALEEGQAQLQADVEELKTDVAGLKTDVAGLKTDVAGLKTDVAGLKTDVAGIHVELNRMNGRMDNGFGTNYEIKVANNFGSIAGRFLRLNRVRLLKAVGFPINNDFSDMIADADENGLITTEQANELLAADLIAFGRIRNNGHEAYVVAEVSITIANSDIIRAAERAGFLAQATGVAAEPIVVGENIAPEQQALAEEWNVIFVPLPST